MKQTSADVERIVREVLARLGDAPSGVATASDTSPGVAEEAAPATPSQRQLVLSGRVVTLAETEGRLDGIRRVVVLPGTIVTPSVRDELVRRNITLAHSQQKPTAASGSVRVVMITAGKQFDSANLAVALVKDGIRLEQHAADCVIPATALLADELADGRTLGVLLSRHTAAGLCLANRHRGVRAVAGCDPAGAARAADAVGANLLIVAPIQNGFFQLKQTIGVFCRGGIRPCPEILREQLS